MKYKLIWSSDLPYVLLLLCWLGCSDASGQIIPDSSWIHQISWTVYCGSTFALPIGKSAKEIRDNHKAWEKQSNEVSEFKGQLNARPGIQIGIQANYSLLEKLGVGIGLQFTQLGYRMKEAQKYRDPQFQYDEQTIIKRIVGLDVLEIPLTATYSLSEYLSVFGGIAPAFLIRKNAAKVNYSFEKEVIINGEYTEENSIPKEKESIPITDQIHKVNLSGMAGIRYLIWPRVAFQLSGQCTSQLFKSEGVFRNILLNGGLSYQFN